VFWLRERHRSIRAVATLLQLPEATIRGYVYNTKWKRVPPETATRIVSLVLAHRKPTGPLDLWEEEPGLRPIILIDRLHLDGYQYLHSTRADLRRRLGAGTRFVPSTSAPSSSHAPNPSAASCDVASPKSATDLARTCPLSIPSFVLVGDIEAEVWVRSSP